MDAIERIFQSIASVDKISSISAAAAQEQGAAIKEIACNVEQAATGTREVSVNIAGVPPPATSETGHVSVQVLSAARQRVHQSTMLHTDVIPS